MSKKMGIGEFIMVCLGVVALLDWVVVPMALGLEPTMSSEWRK